MAKDYDEEEYRRLKSKKRNNEEQQEDCQAEIDSLDDQISRLRAVYNTIDGAKESMEDIKMVHSNMPMFYESLWKGGKAQYFYDMCESGELNANYTGYIKNLDAAEDAINWGINKLEEKKNEKYGILSGLMNAWDDLCTRIRNFFN